MTTRAVFVCLDTLGDLVLRQPLFTAALDAGLEVTVVVRSAYAPLLPHLDPRLATLETGVDPFRLADDSLRQMEELLAQVEAAAPDLLVLTAYSRTHVDEWLLRRARVARRATFDHAASPAVLATLRTVAPDLDLTALAPREVAVAVGESAHEVEKNRALAAALVGRPLPPTEPRLLVDEATRARARAHLRSLGLAPGRFVLGCPGGTANNASKGWPPESYAALVVHLHARHGLPVLLTGLAGEVTRMDDVARRAADHDVPVARHVGDGGELGLLLGLIAESSLYLGVDTGPMHFASALDVPVVALFGGGHWPRFLPRARRSFVATQELPCFRCHWDCFLTEPACLTSVSTPVVTEALDWILGHGPDERRVDRGHRVEPELAQVLKSARARHDQSTAAIEQLSVQLQVSEHRLAEFADLSGRRAGDVRTLAERLREIEGEFADLARRRVDEVQALAERLHVIEQDSLQRLRNMEGLQQIVDEQRRLIAEQQAVLARRSVKIARKLKLP